MIYYLEIEIHYNTTFYFIITKLLPTLPHLQQPLRPETQWQMAIRQTVPMKASVEAETSTTTNKRLFFK